MPAHKKSFIPTPAFIRNLGCLTKMVFVLGVVLVMGYCALVALNPKARKWATQGKKDGSGGPTPFNVVNQVLAIPAQAIGKTKDVVAASDVRTNMVNGVVAEEEGKLKPRSGSAGYVVTDPFAPVAPATPGKSTDAPGDSPAAVSREALIAMNEKAASATDTPDATPDGDTKPALPALVPPPKPAVAPTQIKLVGGIVISSASPDGTAAASQPFLFWVVSLNISGVFQSNPPRLLLNNRLIYENQEVNPVLGITFDHLDLAKKLIVFRDKSGAIVTRSY